MNFTQTGISKKTLMLLCCISLPVSNAWANSTTRVTEPPCKHGFIRVAGVCPKIITPYGIRVPKKPKLDIGKAVHEAVLSFGGPHQGDTITKLQDALASNPPSGRYVVIAKLKDEARQGAAEEKRAQGVASIMGLQIMS